MKDHKKKYILFFSLSAIALGVFFLTSSEKDHTKMKMKKADDDLICKTTDKNKTKKEVVQKDDHKKNKEKLVNSKNQNRVPSSTGPVNNFVGTKTLNRFNKDWKELATRAITSTLTSNFKVQIDHQEQKLLPRGVNHKLVEKVLVTIIHDSGAKSKYTALINSETGKIEYTYGKTEFEKKNFYTTKLEAKYNTLTPLKLKIAK